MKLRFLLISFLSLSFCQFGGVFAAGYLGDCDIVIGEYAGSGTFDSVNRLRKNSTFSTTFEKILDTDSLNQVFLNLQKVCCEQNKDFFASRTEVCQTDAPYFYKGNEGNVPQSYYLFDHALDVLIRRLDGDQENRYLQDHLDQKGEERKTLISSIMQQIEGDENTTPKVISDTYQTYREIRQENLLWGMMQNIWYSLSELITQMTIGKNLEILQRYDEWTLAERYLNTCNIAGFIYALFSNAQNNSESLLATKGHLLDGNTNRCLALLEKKLNATANYTTYVEISKSTMMRTDSLNKYVNTYLGTRLDNLQEMVGNIKIRLLRVVKAVPMLIHIVE